LQVAARTANAWTLAFQTAKKNLKGIFCQNIPIIPFTCVIFQLKNKKQKKTNIFFFKKKKAKRKEKKREWLSKKVAATPLSGGVGVRATPA